MFDYFLVQFLWTLLGLAFLSLCGAWILRPFFSEARPFLWLASPLAGLSTLSLSLSGLYHFFNCSLPVAVCYICVFCLIATFLSFRRSHLCGLFSFHFSFGFAVCLFVSAVSVQAVQSTAIRVGEPTLVMVGGSDHFGYAHIADWLLHHPHEPAIASPERPYESWVELMLNHDPRYGAFLISALAGWARGTTSLFSFDYAICVIFSAGLLGVASAFAKRPGLLLVLLGAFACTLWFRNARTGYLGKTLTYPGFLLLVHLMLTTWRHFTFSRIVSFSILCLGFGLTLSPLALVALAAVAGGAILATRLLANLLDLVRRPSHYVPDVGPLWLGLLLAISAILPCALAAPGPFREQSFSHPWGHNVSTDFVLAEALDVSVPWETPDQPSSLRVILVRISLVSSVVGGILSLYFRATASAGLLFTSCFALLAFDKSRIWSIYQLQGLLYPLTLAGAALLLQPESTLLSRRRWLCGLILILVLIGLRLPQLYGSAKMVSNLQPGVPGFVARSHVTDLVARIQGKTVDVCLHDTCPAILLLVELGVRDIDFQLRPPSWRKTMAYRPWLTPTYPRCGEFLLTPWDSQVDVSGGIRGPLWALVPGDGTWIGSVTNSLPQGRTTEYGWYFWVGKEWTFVEISNVNDFPCHCLFLARSEIRSEPAESARRTLVWECAGDSGQLELTARNGEVRLPLELPKGDHRLRLRIAQSDSSDTPEKQLLLFQIGLQSRAEFPVLNQDSQHPKSASPK